MGFFILNKAVAHTVKHRDSSRILLSLVKYQITSPKNHGPHLKRPNFLVSGCRQILFEITSCKMIFHETTAKFQFRKFEMNRSLRLKGLEARFLQESGGRQILCEARSCKMIFCETTAKLFLEFVMNCGLRLKKLEAQFI